MMLVEGGKADFIIDIGIGTTAKGFYRAVGRKTRLNSKYSMGQGEFIAKEHGGGQWMENY